VHYEHAYSTDSEDEGGHHDEYEKRIKWWRWVTENDELSKVGRLDFYSGFFGCLRCLENRHYPPRWTPPLWRRSD
jgi:hypothetical protein